jgi:CheY-like chemotaxis protein
MWGSSITDKRLRRNLLANILVVDDEPGSARLLEYMLKRQNHTMVSAENGYQALERLNEQGFDLLITDIMMPGMDGLTLIEEVRMNRQITDMPIIVITAYGFLNISQEVMSKGATHILTQPYSSKELSEAVFSCLNNP